MRSLNLVIGAIFLALTMFFSPIAFADYVYIGDLTASGALKSGAWLDMKGKTSYPLSQANSARIVYDPSMNKLLLSLNGAAYVDMLAAGGGGVTGSGAINTIPLFGGASALTNSLLAQSGGKVVYSGTTAPLGTEVYLDSRKYSGFTSNASYNAGQATANVTAFGTACGDATTAGQTLLVPAGVTYWVNANVTFACPVELDGQIAVNGSSTVVTFNGGFNSPANHQAFVNALGTAAFPAQGKVVLGQKSVVAALPEWWGATGQGSRMVSAQMAASSTTVSAAPGTFTAGDIGKTVYVPNSGASTMDPDCPSACLIDGDEEYNSTVGVVTAVAGDGSSVTLGSASPAKFYQGAAITNTAVYSTPAQTTIPGGGIANVKVGVGFDDNAPVQAAIDSIRTIGGTVQFSPGKTYNVASIGTPAGIRLTGPSTIQSPPGTAENQFWRMLNAVALSAVYGADYQYSGATDSPTLTIDNLILDGNRANQERYTAFEREQNNNLTLGADPTNTGRLRANIHDVQFRETTGDGCNFLSNSAPNFSNISGWNNFRGGLTGGQGNTELFVNGYLSGGDVYQYAINLEPDTPTKYAGFLTSTGGTAVHGTNDTTGGGSVAPNFVAQLTVGQRIVAGGQMATIASITDSDDLVLAAPGFSPNLTNVTFNPDSPYRATITNVVMEGGLDIAGYGSSSLSFNNVVMKNGPFNLNAGGTGNIMATNCVFVNGENHLTTNNLLAPGTAKFTNCRFIGQEVVEATSTTVNAVTLGWGSGANQTVTFNNCSFEYDNSLEAADTAKAVFINNSLTANNNTVEITNSRVVGALWDMAVWENLGGKLVIKDSTLQGTTAMQLGSGASNLIDLTLNNVTPVGVTTYLNIPGNFANTVKWDNVPLDSTENTLTGLGLANGASTLFRGGRTIYGSSAPVDGTTPGEVGDRFRLKTPVSATTAEWVCTAGGVPASSVWKPVAAAGVIPVAQGGTGIAAPTANTLLVGNGTTFDQATLGGGLTYTGGVLDSVAGGVGGTGLATRITKFTAPGTIASSSLADNGTNINYVSTGKKLQQESVFDVTDPRFGAKGDAKAITVTVNAGVVTDSTATLTTAADGGDAKWVQVPNASEYDLAAQLATGSNKIDKGTLSADINASVGVVLSSPITLTAPGASNWATNLSAKIGGRAYTIAIEDNGGGNKELIACDSVSVNDFYNCSRGFDGTAAASHTAATSTVTVAAMDVTKTGDHSEVRSGVLQFHSPNIGQRMTFTGRGITGAKVQSIKQIHFRSSNENEWTANIDQSATTSSGVGGDTAGYLFYPYYAKLTSVDPSTHAMTFNAAGASGTVGSHTASFTETAWVATDDTASVQAAVDAAALAATNRPGGATVVFPDGNYFFQNVNLPSNVKIEYRGGAKCVGMKSFIAVNNDFNTGGFGGPSFFKTTGTLGFDEVQLSDYVQHNTSTLNGAIDGQTTSVVLAAPSGGSPAYAAGGWANNLPATGYLLIDNELLPYTSIATNTFTVTRAGYQPTGTTSTISQGLLVGNGAGNNITAGDTTIRLGNFNQGSNTWFTTLGSVSGTMRIDSEIITFSAISTNDFTVTSRGASGTSAAAHRVGALVTVSLNHANAAAVKFVIPPCYAVNGGSLTANHTYYYKISATDNGSPQKETKLSSTMQFATTDATNKKIYLSIPDTTQAAAQNYVIYRSDGVNVNSGIYSWQRIRTVAKTASDEWASGELAYPNGTLMLVDDGTSTPVNPTIQSVNQSYAPVQNAQIIGGEFDGNHAYAYVWDVVYAKNLTAHNIRSYDTNDSSMRWRNVERGDVSNCWFTGSQKNLLLWDTSSINVHENRLEKGYYQGALVYHSQGNITTSNQAGTDNNFHHNDIYNWGNDGGDGHNEAVLYYGQISGDFSGNHIHDEYSPGGYSLRLRDSENITTMYNRIDANSYGIISDSVNDFQNVTVNGADNFLSNDRPQLGGYNRIAHNMVVNAQGVGIQVSNTNVTLTAGGVNSSFYTYSSYGGSGRTSMQPYTGTVMYPVDVDSNHIFKCGTFDLSAASNGILVKVSGSRVTNNRVENTADGAIVISLNNQPGIPVAGYQPTNVQVSGNYIHNVARGTSGDFSHAKGIVTFGLNTILANNTLVNDATPGSSTALTVGIVTTGAPYGALDYSAQVWGNTASNWTTTATSFASASGAQGRTSTNTATKDVVLDAPTVSNNTALQWLRSDNTPFDALIVDGSNNFFLKTPASGTGSPGTMISRIAGAGTWGVQVNGTNYNLKTDTNGTYVGPLNGTTGASFVGGRIFVGTASVTVSNSTAITTLLPAGQGITTIPANSWTVGKKLLIHAEGNYGTFSTAPAVIKLRINLGAGPTTFILCSTGVAPTSSLSNIQGWTFDGHITCRTTGSPGTALAAGVLRLNNETTGAVLSASSYPNSVVAQNLDTAVAQLFGITVEMQITANAANTFTLSDLSLQWVN